MTDERGFMPITIGGKNAGTMIDRRLDGKNKSAVNRERFIRRFKNQIKKAITDSLKGRSITDLDPMKGITIPRKDLSEPTFGHGSGGYRETVHPGNREFVKGDRIARPQGGGGRGGSGSGQASNSGEGEDDFVFELSREEFFNILFEDLELPYLVRTQLVQAVELKSERAGFSSVGSPASIDVVRSYKRGYPLWKVLTGPVRQELRIVNERIFDFSEADNLQEVVSLLQYRKELLVRMRGFSRFEPSRLCYRRRELRPQPTTRAVIFCIMDVSGSMDQARKDLAKRFFTLLYFFLKRSYEKVEVVFVRHTTTAEEVNEQEFFYGRNTGGTAVSSALRLTADIQHDRYPASKWNVYVAQASDGDDWHDDPAICGDILRKEIMKVARYFAYVEIAPDRHQKLWEVYLKVGEEYPNFSMRQIDGPSDIHPVFRDLFKRRTN